MGLPMRNIDGELLPEWLMLKWCSVGYWVVHHLGYVEAYSSYSTFAAPRIL